MFAYRKSLLRSSRAGKVAIAQFLADLESAARDEMHPRRNANGNFPQTSLREARA